MNAGFSYQAMPPLQFSGVVRKLIPHFKAGFESSQTVWSSDEFYVTRSDVLEAEILESLLSSKSKGPTMIYGLPGSGKSVLMGRLAKETS